jgi:uncharacterized membrane protein YgdD (TMEM256/DUF423 family)
MTPRIAAILGASLAALAVAAGAFGAHALANRLEPRMLEVWETAARYNMYHALGLFVAAWLGWQTQTTAAQAAAFAFLAGIVLFSGSLYTMALSGVKWLGAITPRDRHLARRPANLPPPQPHPPG